MIAYHTINASLVVAACRSNRGIGLDGALPWPNLPKDLAHFKSLTTNSAVLMGSSTYDSLPSSVKPLPNRLNLVLSSRTRAQLSYPDSVIIVGSLDAATDILLARRQTNVFVIGGESVYRAALSRPEWSSRIYYTEIRNHFQADRFFPIDLNAENSDFDIVSMSADQFDHTTAFRFIEYVRRVPGATLPNVLPSQLPHPEMQYLNLVQRILRTGVLRGDRTGTGTISLFGESMRFSLRDSFPLLTTKRVFWRGVAEELFWFINGSTDGNKLAERRVHIWDGNGSREFLDKRGFTDRAVGDLGPVYGFQWRHFGAEYTDMNTDYTGHGVDQLVNLINTIKTNPNDRRMLLCAWNPAATHLMALPPCHLLAQFYVANCELSCQMYQRSCDMGLGVPFNIASYSLLTRLIAEVTGLKAGDFVHVLGDAHVYTNHVDALTEQLKREPRPFPTLKIRHRDSIEEFCFEDLTLEGYDPHDALKMKMAV